MDKYIADGIIGRLLVMRHHGDVIEGEHEQRRVFFGTGKSLYAAAVAKRFSVAVHF